MTNQILENYKQITITKIPIPKHLPLFGISVIGSLYIVCDLVIVICDSLLFTL